MGEVGQLVVLVGDEGDVHAGGLQRAAELKGVMDHAALSGGLDVGDLHAGQLQQDLRRRSPWSDGLTVAPRPACGERVPRSGG
jgi:hypothetical protein